VGPVVVDASTLLDILHKTRSDSQALLAVPFDAGADLHVPASAYSEILVHPYRTSQEAVDGVDQFLNRLRIRVQPITAEIAHETARIRARHRVRTRDALVLASAVILEATLLTADRQMQQRWHEITGGGATG
jgi:predicted nucleic acid-binding protein